MKYLKYFENQFEYNLVTDKPNEKVYDTIIDGIDYYSKYYLYKNNVWVHDYNYSSNHEINKHRRKNPDNIISTITDITHDFIRKVNPNAIIIHHIPMRRETEETKKLNYRALLNYQYLKHIPGYELIYYNMIGYKSNTICYMVKPEFLKKNPFELYKGAIPDNVEFEKVDV